MSIVGAGDFAPYTSILLDLSWFMGSGGWTCPGGGLCTKAPSGAGLTPFTILGWLVGWTPLVIGGVLQLGR